MNLQPPDNMLPAAMVWRRYGKTDRTLDRWLKDETLGSNGADTASPE